MNNAVKDKMSADLARSREWWGAIGGFGLFLVAYVVVSFLPGMKELMATHGWPAWVLFAIFYGGGLYLGNQAEGKAHVAYFAYEDDLLKYEHSKLSGIRLKAGIAAAVLLALAYFIFRNRWALLF